MSQGDCKWQIMLYREESTNYERKGTIKLSLLIDRLVCGDLDLDYLTNKNLH